MLGVALGQANEDTIKKKKEKKTKQKIGRVDLN